MAGVVDLEDLVEDVKAELTVPGSTSYVGSTTAQWVAQLRNAFWEARLDQVITGYSEADGLVTPTSGDTPLSRELQQVLIYYAGVKVLKNYLTTLRTEFRAKGGQAEVEFRQSAAVLVALYKDLTTRRDQWITYLGEAGIVPSYYIDAAQARFYNDGLGGFNGMY